MQALCRVLDLAESKGIGVTLVSWGVPKGSFLAQGNTAQNWVVGAKGTTAIAEYCENFSAVVQWLLNEKKYTCVDWITPGNEPDWAWEIDDVHGDATAYAAMCKELDRRFEADGIRDKVKFNLGDATKNGAKRWFEAIQDELKGIADVVNTHTYEFSSRHENKEIAAWVRQNKAFADEIGADYYMGEFGSYEDGTIEKMDSFERGVGLARQMMNYFNHGVSGMSYWILFDQHYSAAPFAESMSANGLWYSYKRFYANTDYENRVHEDFAVRNHYYMYSMLSRSIGANETVYPLNIKHEFIIGTRFLRRNGKQTFALVNQTEEGMRYCFREADKSAQYEYLVYTRDAPPEGDAVIAPSNVLKAKNGYVSFIAPAESVLVIRQK